MPYIVGFGHPTPITGPSRARRTFSSDSPRAEGGGRTDQLSVPEPDGWGDDTRNQAANDDPQEHRPRTRLG